MTMWLTTEESILIPDGISDLDTFRAWFQSGSFPEKCRLHFLDGAVRIDASYEQLFTHNQVKNEIGVVLSRLIKESIGTLFSRRNPDLNLAAN